MVSQGRQMHLSIENIYLDRKYNPRASQWNRRVLETCQMYVLLIVLHIAFVTLRTPSLSGCSLISGVHPVSPHLMPFIFMAG